MIDVDVYMAIVGALCLLLLIYTDIISIDSLADAIEKLDNIKL